MKYEKIDRKAEGSAGKQFAHFVKVGYNRARQVHVMVLRRVFRHTDAINGRDESTHFRLLRWTAIIHYPRLETDLD